MLYCISEVIESKIPYSGLFSFGQKFVLRILRTNLLPHEKLRVKKFAFLIGRCGQWNPCEMERYFKPVARPLPNPHGDLAKLVPTISLKEANKHMEEVMSKGKQRLEYQKVSMALIICGTWPTIRFSFVTATAYGSWTFPGSRRQTSSSLVTGIHRSL